MAFSTKFGSFNTGTAAAGNTVAVTGVGFQPKVVLMWWIGRTDTTDAVGRAAQRFGFGAAISTTSRYCTTHYSADAAASSDGGLLASSTACVQTCDGAGASTGALDLQSMDAGGFTLVVDIQFAASYRVHYLALGGTDLTNYALGTMTAPTTTGNLAYTGVGFQADLVLMLINAVNGGIGGSSTRQPMHIGAAKSSSSRWTASAGQDDNSATMDAWSYSNDIECVGVISGTGGATPEAQADFVSMGSDGFTLNWTRAYATTARGGWYLALKGGQYALGSILTKTDTTTDIVVSGLGFAPVGGLVVSTNHAEHTINTATANANMSVGGFDSATSRGGMAYMDQDALADSEVTTAVEHDEIYANVDGGALLGLMDVKSMDSGGVTFIMDDADPAQYFATYLLFGSSTTNTTIVLDTATVTAGGVALTTVPGAVTKALSTAALVANGRAISITNVNIVALNTAVLAANGQAFTIVPGAISTLLDSAALLSNGQALTVVPGAYSLTLSTAILTANGQTVQVGNINIIALNTAALLAGGQALTVAPGAISTLLDTALLTTNGQVFTVVPGAMTKALSTALLSANGQAFAVVPGDVIKALVTAILSATGQGATLVPGAVTTLLSAAQLTANGITIAIQTAGGGAVTITLSTASLLAGGVVLDVVPGDVSTALNTAQLTAAGISAALVPGAVTMNLSTATLTANGQVITLDMILQAVVRTWTLRDRDTSFTLADRDAAWSLKNRDVEWSLDDRDTEWSLRDRDTSWTVNDR